MGVKEADPEHCPLVAFMTERKDPEAELTGARGSLEEEGVSLLPPPICQSGRGRCPGLGRLSQPSLCLLHALQALRGEMQRLHGEDRTY